MRWNEESLKDRYDRCIEELREYGFDEDSIERLKTDRLSAAEFKTGSTRIARMVLAAYFVGKMAGIRECDGINTLISPS